MRVTDDEVMSWLTWMRNYGEISSFKKLGARGRKWLIILPEGATITKTGGEMSVLDSLVPDEFVLTSREALTFAMGAAVGGSRSETRRQTATGRWGWD